MSKIKKLEFARWMIQRISPVVLTRGRHSPARGMEPAHYEYELSDVQLCLAVAVLRSPDRRALSNILDAWPTVDHRKVFSVAWTPDQPWLPPEIVRFRSGSWMDQLGWPTMEDRG